MRIIVTGAGGFVGRALVTRLARAHDVVAVDRTHAAITGDIADPDLLDTLFATPADAVVHFATIAGGAAEGDPALAKHVNVDATMALVDAATAYGNRPRFIFASSIAVFGDPLPAHVDDTTPLAPRMLYGAHKAMMETWIATRSRRGTIDGLSLRLPAIVARPRGTSGMKSAYLSELFHAMQAGEAFTMPVSPRATSWLLSLPAVVACIIHALDLPMVPQERALTLPALRVTMADLIAAIAKATGTDPAITHAPDAALEAAFGNQPPLATPRADALGFVHDGDLSALVTRTLDTLT